MKIGVYPGSFDPITKGHLDVIERGTKVFDKLIIAILVNITKQGFFDYQERMELIKKSTSHLDNVEVRCFEGLLIDFMKEVESKVILKGLRTVSDFEYEYQMALMNKKLNGDIETMFVMSSGEYSYISSTAVKQVIAFKGNIDGLVPDEIIDDINNKIKDN